MVAYDNGMIEVNGVPMGSVESGSTDARRDPDESAGDHGDPIPEPRYRPAIYAAGSNG